jgi:hypothetical protein
VKKGLFLLTILAVSLGLASCGPEDSPFSPISRSQLKEGGLHITVSASDQGAAGMSFHIGVVNGSFQAATVRFSSGQIFDIEVTDGVGNLVWQWAYNKYFTQGSWQFELSPGESYSREADWDLTDNDKRPLPPGSYRAKVYITNFPRDEGLSTWISLVF